MNTAIADALGRELVALHDAPREVPPFSERHPGLTLETAYAAARRLHAHRVAQGFVPRGRKIGFTNRTLWARYGVSEPMWGTVYDRTLVVRRGATARGSRWPAWFSRGSSPRSASGSRAAPRDGSPEALLEAIAWVTHSIEIVQCHHPGWKVDDPRLRRRQRAPRPPRGRSPDPA